MKPSSTLALGLLLGLGSVVPAMAAPAARAEPEETAAPPAEVVALLQRADAAFEEGRLLDAWDAIDEAEALQPGPLYEYMRGLIRQAQGRCDLAVQHWDRYLQSEPGEADAAEVRRLIDECGGLPEPAPAPEPEPEPEQASTPTPAEPDPTSPESAPRPWHRDVAGGVLLGTGLAAVAAGGGLLAGAAVVTGRAPEGARLMDHDADVQRARTLSYVSIGATALGVGLLVGATVRYIRVKRKSRNGAQARRWRPLALRPGF